MQVKNLLTEDRAVSPVIGVILMVAITVILAAVIGTFVLGLGQNVNSTPQANFGFEFKEASGGGTWNVTVTHEGGDQLSSDNSGSIDISVSDGVVSSENWLDHNDPIQAGDDYVFGDGNTDGTDGGSTQLNSGTTVRVIWTAPGGGDSSVIASQDVPT